MEFYATVIHVRGIASYKILIFSMRKCKYQVGNITVVFHSFDLFLLLQTPQQFHFRSEYGSAYYSTLIDGVKENSSGTETITVRSLLLLALPFDKGIFLGVRYFRYFTYFIIYTLVKRRLMLHWRVSFPLLHIFVEDSFYLDTYLANSIWLLRRSLCANTLQRELCRRISSCSHLCRYWRKRLYYDSVNKWPKLSRFMFFSAICDIKHTSFKHWIYESIRQ